MVATKNESKTVAADEQGKPMCHCVYCHESHEADSSSKCIGPPHDLDLPEREEKYSFSRSKWSINCQRVGCEKSWVRMSNEGDMPPSSWECDEGISRGNINGSRGCRVKGHAYGIDGLRERYEKFPGDVEVWRPGFGGYCAELAQALDELPDGENPDTLFDKYFKEDDVGITRLECKECFLLDNEHGIGRSCLEEADAGKGGKRQKVAK